MLLRIPSFRGAQVATGVVVLTTLAVLLEIRMAWSPGAHLAATGGLGAFVWVLLVETPPADGRARPWLAALCLCGVLLVAVALGHVFDLLGGHGFYDRHGDHAHRALTLGALLVCAGAAWCSRVRGAASCALAAGAAGTIALVELAYWVAHPSAGTVRWLLLLAAVVLLVLTLAHRDSRPVHGAQFANAGGLAVAAIGVEALLPTLIRFIGEPQRSPGLATGWELTLAAAGFGLLAYGAVDDQRGPVVVGLLNLALFVGAVGVPQSDLVGWPLFLLAAGLVFLVIGVRPTTPAPPEPGVGDEPPPPLEVHVR